MNLDDIRRKILSRQYRISWTHTEKLRRRRISSLMIERAIETGIVIESYPNDARGPSCLILGYSLEGRPLHVVCGTLDDAEILIITAYEPSPAEWESDWRTRRGAPQQ
jgi:hypothetical protein